MLMILTSLILKRYKIKQLRYQPQVIMYQDGKKWY
jgi:hypothetical protein